MKGQSALYRHPEMMLVSDLRDIAMEKRREGGGGWITHYHNAKIRKRLYHRTAVSSLRTAFRQYHNVTLPLADIYN